MTTHNKNKLDLIPFIVNVSLTLPIAGTILFYVTICVYNPIAGVLFPLFIIVMHLLLNVFNRVGTFLFYSRFDRLK